MEDTHTHTHTHVGRFASAPIPLWLAKRNGGGSDSVAQEFDYGSCLQMKTLAFGTKLDIIETLDETR